MKRQVLFVLLLLPSLLSAQSLNQFFDLSNQFFGKYVINDNVDYKAIKKNKEDIKQLTVLISEANLEGLSDNEIKAFRVNAYNILVIKGILVDYPTPSPKAFAGFFESRQYVVAGKKQTLNDLEKKGLLKAYPDARWHFVLVCGAKGCPPIAPFAYMPNTLDDQLYERTLLAMNDARFVRVDKAKKTVFISELFDWYVDDFKREGGVRTFINEYKEQVIPKNYKVKYYDYDWQLNDKGADVAAFDTPTYQTGKLLPPKQLELKIFNNLYTQRSPDGHDGLNSRSSFFSSFWQTSYGLNQHVNVGFDVVFKANRLNDLAKASPFKTLKLKASNELQVSRFQDTLMTSSSFGIGLIGAKIRVQPVRKWADFSIQQSIYVPVHSRVENNFVSSTQFFFDRRVARRSNLFVEVSVWWSVAKDFKSHSPYPDVKVFYSYFPTQKWTVYGMAAIRELGGGMKYQLTNHLEVEALYTRFLPYTFNDGRKAETFNIGFRFTR